MSSNEGGCQRPAGLDPEEEEEWESGSDMARKA